ncbi:uncharacterized protein JCM10292_006365 [Rhodotorula paludigena]|uniref:uncharacterized protein n=1 Tax=Rhodotorula paludigena TaxID=86838 RepID=UPI003171F1FA
MAEALHDPDSPFHAYLRRESRFLSPLSRRHEPLTPLPPFPRAETDADSPASPIKRDFAGPLPAASAQPRPPSPSPSSSSPPRQQPVPPPPKRSRQLAATAERVKYAIATSALLSAKLGDALQLYPPLDDLARATLDCTRSKDAALTRASRKGKARAPKQAAAEWGYGWETRGQGVLERGVLGSATAALGGLVGALARGSKPATIDEGSEGEEEGVGADQADKRNEAGAPAQLLGSVEGFIVSAQELDLRVANALSAIKELECIAHGLGLSDPLPPISRIEARAYLSKRKPTSPTSANMLSTPSRSPRIPSPLGLPSSASSSTPDDVSPPPLRAQALRRALASALSDALAALSTSTAALNALLPASSPLLQHSTATAASESTHAPSASLSELMRHDSRARQERDELVAAAAAAASPVSASSAAAATAVVDPFHPTESTFGGIERRRAELDAGTGADEDDAAPGSPAGPGARAGLAAKPRRSQRPLSLGGASGLPAATSSPSDDDAADRDATERLLLVSLQEQFDDLHALRRGVVWRVIEVVDHPADAATADEACGAAARALEQLGERLAGAAQGVARAHASEFGESPAATDHSSAVPAREHAGAPAGGGSEGMQRTTSASEREKRRRSGLYGRGEEAAHVPSSSAAQWAPPPPPAAGGGRTSAPSTPTAPPRPAAAGLRRVPSASSSAAPSSFANFAPPAGGLLASPLSRSALTAASAGPGTDPALVALVQGMSLSLRAVQAKLRLVLADAGAAGADDKAREGAWRAWEGVGAEVRRLEAEWRGGEGVVRKALGLEKEMRLEESAEAEQADQAGALVLEIEPEAQDVEESDDLNAKGAVDATLDASASPAPAAADDERQALLDAALSLSLLPPADSPSEEKVFEAVAGPDRRAPSAADKLSRDERIRRMKEAREALALGRSSLESPGKGASPGPGGGGVDAQRNMVGELREVLKELNREKGREETPPAVAPEPQTASPAAPPLPARALPSAAPPQEVAPPPQSPAKAAPPPPAASRPSPAQPRFVPLPAVSSQQHAPSPPQSPTKAVARPRSSSVQQQPRFVPPPPVATAAQHVPFIPASPTKVVSPPPAPNAALPPRGAVPPPPPPKCAPPPSASTTNKSSPQQAPLSLPPAAPITPRAQAQQLAHATPPSAGPRYVSPPPPSSSGRQPIPRFVSPPPAASPSGPNLPQRPPIGVSSAPRYGPPPGGAASSPASPVRARPPAAAAPPAQAQQPLRYVAPVASTPQRALQQSTKDDGSGSAVGAEETPSPASAPRRRPVQTV